MPYNSYYQNYPFMQGMPYMQNYQQPIQQAQQIQQPAQIQDGGVVCVKDETAARNYPIAPGVSMTLIDEPRQHLFIKTMGFNQLEKPVFKKFQLIPENENNGDLSGVSPETVKDTNNELYGKPDKPEMIGYSTEPPQVDNSRQIVEYDGKSDFAQAVNGMPIERVMSVFDELMTALYVENRAMYRAVLRQLSE